MFENFWRILRNVGKLLHSQMQATAVIRAEPIWGAIAPLPRAGYGPFTHVLVRFRLRPHPECRSRARRRAKDAQLGLQPSLPTASAFAVSLERLETLRGCSGARVLLFHTPNKSVLAQGSLALKHAVSANLYRSETRA